MQKNNNGVNIVAVLLLAVFVFIVSLGVDFALVGIASLVSGIDASFRELLGAAIIVAAAQSSIAA